MSSGSPAAPLLICDLGGVLLEFSWDRAVSSWASATGRAPTAIQSSFDPHDDAGRDFERGLIGENRYFAHLRASCGLELSDEDLAHGWDAIFTGVSSEVLSLLEQAKGGGHRIVVASNTNATHERYWRERFAAELSVFDAVYCSSSMGARKPEAAFFEGVLAAEGVLPGSAVFVDDTQANVEGAEAVGLSAFHFAGPDDLADMLRRSGLI